MNVVDSKILSNTGPKEKVICWVVGGDVKDLDGARAEIEVEISWSQILNSLGHAEAELEKKKTCQRDIESRALRTRTDLRLCSVKPETAFVTSTTSRTNLTVTSNNDSGDGGGTVYAGTVLTWAKA